MGLWLRTLFIWLLMLAVPAQGAAAATMAFCGPNHHGGGAAAQAQPHAVHAHSHVGAGAHDAAEHEAVFGLDHHEGDVSASVYASDMDTPATPHTCSACASCCSLGALVCALPGVPAPLPSTTVFRVAVTTVDAFSAGGPDRPPRAFLA